MGLPDQKHLIRNSIGERDKEYIKLTNNSTLNNYEHTLCSHIRARRMTPRCTYSSPNGILSA